MSRKEKIAAFMGIECGLTALCTLPLFLLRPRPASLPVMLASVVFMLLPALTTLIVRRLAHDRSGLFLRLNLRKAWRQYLLAAFLPGVLTGLGAALYFLIFPSQFDLSLSYIGGQAPGLPRLTLPAVIGFGFLFILAAPLVVVNHAAAFGEEVGWRAFLLPLLVEEWGVRRAVLLNGVLWGLVHAPLVCFGLNYTGSYPGAPWSGILMMVLFAVSTGMFLSWLTLSSGSIFPACIAHGAINAVREAPLLICLDTCNVLLGPKPSGLIGMTGFLILGAAVFVRLARYPQVKKDG